MDFDDIKDFENKITEINNRFSYLISEFIGFDISFSISRNKTKNSYDLGAKSYFVTYNTSLKKKITEDIVSRAVYFMSRYIEENDIITARMYNNFIDEVSMALVFQDYTEKNEETKFKQLNFIEDLKKVSFKTYECNNVNMGVIQIPDCIGEEEFIKNFDFEYINIESDKTIVELIESEKPLLKIIDNKSAALVINNNFLVTGIIKKKQGGISIHQIFENRYAENDGFHLKLLIFENLIVTMKKLMSNEARNRFSDYVHKKASTSKIKAGNIFDFFIKNNDKSIDRILNKMSELKSKIKENSYPIKYISIRDMEISYYGNDNFLLTYNQSKWKTKQYNVLINYIFEYIMPVETLVMNFMLMYEDSDKDWLFNEIDESLEKIYKLLKIIKNLSLNHDGALFVIVNNSELNKEECEYLRKAIPEGLIRSRNEKEKKYKAVIRKNDYSIANILELDNYLLESIASVDGATILDEELNVLSFSEIINIRSSISSKKQNIYGARTTAAISASKYGLAIKVSEDGDIEIYREKKLKIKI